MKYVDEYRDPAIAHALIGQVTRMSTPALGADGSMRGPDAHVDALRHRRFADERGGTGTRAGLSGMRHAA